MSFRFVPTQRVKENSKKIAKIFKKLENPIMASFQAKIGGERPRKRKIKIFFPFPSDRTGNRKFQKKIRNSKKSKNTIVASIQAQIDWKLSRKRENKKCRSVSFLPNA